MNKLFFIIFFVFFFLNKLIANPNINARTGILIDYHSDEIIYEFDPDTNSCTMKTDFPNPTKD